MKKRIVLSVLAAAIVALTSFIGYRSLSSQPSEADILLNENIDALTSGEDLNPFCYNGGRGAVYCSIDGGINVFGYGVSASCSVACVSGYYACCGIRCTCKKG